jgi:hypothetical protein
MTEKRFNLGRTERGKTGRKGEATSTQVDSFVAAQEPETSKTFRLPISLSRRLRIRAAHTGQTEKEILIRLLSEYLDGVDGNNE